MNKEISNERKIEILTSDFTNDKARLFTASVPTFLSSLVLLLYFSVLIFKYCENRCSTIKTPILSISLRSSQSKVNTDSEENTESEVTKILEATESYPEEYEYYDDSGNFVLFIVKYSKMII
jgi:uncharacterized membrane protein YgaE (UPF0421/DUF939 family)